jgi:hypothetical protein
MFDIDCDKHRDEYQLLSIEMAKFVLDTHPDQEYVSAMCREIMWHHRDKITEIVNLARENDPQWYEAHGKRIDELYAWIVDMEERLAGA